MVEFHRKVSDEELVDLYNQCDLFVLPSTSRREAFGLVELEALSENRVVASDISGTGEVAKTADGFLAKPNDHIALAREILKAIEAPQAGEGEPKQKARSP